ncbi:hypothetical protein P167DRAFT_533828 [Morchella conica CCBAS932]|uniref:Uncharacterized protein n=1 Tax=Morchella conica CCBAS932 TaxID=1392247 RepID=A0A3N4KWB3_9PEZI|nr:hypothetical protein P167DRAFT_533828 [Morchella conica CCBAS932]
MLGIQLCKCKLEKKGVRDQSSLVTDNGNRYLNPTWTNPAYQAKIGNPNFEAKPEWTLQNNFTIDTETVGDASIEYFGYLHQYKDKWLACNDNGIYTIYL